MAIQPDKTRLMAAAVVTAAVASDVAFVIFAATGEPWGTINDLGIAISGFAVAGLTASTTDASGRGARALSWSGAAVSAVGSGMVISRATGWLLAGFVGSVGYGLMGPGVIATSRHLAERGRISRRVGLLGQLTGALMTVGLLGAIPTARRLDDAAKAPWWSWVAYTGTGAGLLVLPAWAVGVARAGREEA